MRKGMWIVVMGLVVGGLWQPRVEALILINELLADPLGDANRDGTTHSLQDEFVELVNTGSDAVSLAQWTVSDQIRVRHAFSSTASIPGFSFFVVFGGGNPQGFGPNSAIASTGGLGLNNDGDTVTLKDASATLINVVSYSTEGGMDVSLTRSPDADGPFVPHSSVSDYPFSPGTTVQGLSSLFNPELPPPTVEPSPPVEPLTPVIPPDPTSGPTDPGLPHDHGESPVVPEPASLMLAGLGLISLPLLRRTITVT